MTENPNQADVPDPTGETGQSGRTPEPPPEPDPENPGVVVDARGVVEHEIVSPNTGR